MDGVRWKSRGNVDGWILSGGQGGAVVCCVHRESDDDGKDYEFPFPSPGGSVKPFESEDFFMNVCT